MINSGKSGILFLLHTPPPVHGSSLVGLSIVESKKINETYNCRFINLLISKTVDETGKRSILKIYRFIRIWIKILFQLIKRKPQLCYFALTANGFAFYKDVLLVFFLRIFRIKTVYHLHNKGFSINAKSKVYSLLYRFVFIDSEVILLSKLLYNDIKSFVPESKVHICPNGIAEIIQKNKVQRANIKGEKTNILFLSNLIESKGVYILLEACKLLDKKNIDFSCSFIGGEGDITAKQLNKKIKQLELEDKVKYVGKKYGDEKNKYWQTADVFVFPTYYNYECFPLVLLEAMQFSLPVISTFEGGIPDIVENGITGILVPQEDVKTLADELEFLIDNPEKRKQMGKKGKIKYDEEFTFEKFETKMIDILNQCIS